MKTFVDFPDSLYRRAQARAAERGISLGEVVVEALEKDLTSIRAGRPGDRPHFDIDELGLPRLRRNPGDATVVTEAFLSQLREQHGI